MKKVISLVSAALLAVSLLFAAVSCAPEVQVEVGEGPLGAYSPTIKITYCRPYLPSDEANLNQLGYSLTENNWFDLIEEELGIRIWVDWYFNDYAAYFDKLFLSAVEGDIPDLVDISAGTSAYQAVKTLYNADLITELDDVIKNYTSEDAAKRYEYAGEEIYYPARMNGKTYALPQVTGGEGSAMSFYYIRKDWLDNLGMAVPSNFDELAAVITAFATQDPDGNNQDDTFGIALNSIQSREMNAIFNGFEAYPNIWIENDEGDLVYGSVQPEVKKAVTYVADLVKSGYADYAPVSGNMPGNMFIRNKAGIVIGQTNSILDLAKVTNNVDTAEIAVVPAFKEDGSAASVVAGTNAYRYYCVSRQCRYPEVVVKLSNFIIDMSIKSDSDHELFNEYFTRDGKIHVYNYAPVVQEDYPGRNYQLSLKLRQVLEEDDESLLESELEKEVYSYVKKFENGDNSYRGWSLLYGIDGVQQLQGNFFENDLYVHDKFVSSQTATMDTSWQDLVTLELAGMGQIIVGEQQVDYFDMVINDWKEQGGDAITEEVNAWYSSMMGE